MLCFRDRTFCPFWGECAKGDTCDRACTPAVEKKAAEHGLPVCVFIDRPDCFMEDVDDA